MDRVFIYDGSDGHKELAIKVTTEECFNWGGLAVCDLCNEDSDGFLYLCPELGSNALCSKCFEEHKGRVKFYQEDVPYILNSLLSYANNYGLEFSDTDMKTILTYVALLKEVV